MTSLAHDQAHYALPDAVRNKRKVKPRVRARTTAPITAILQFVPSPSTSIAVEDLQVRKKFLQERNVNFAKEMASRLVTREARGPGDLENAMRRIEARYGVPYGLLWGLRYRPPKDILLQPFQCLLAAYRAECERQMRQLQHEIKITKATAGANHPAVRAAEALVDEEP